MAQQPTGFYQASKTHYGDIKYKLKHLVRKRSRLKENQKHTLLNPVPTCPVRAGVELDATYQDVNLEDRFSDVTDPNIDISITLTSLFQLIGQLFQPTRMVKLLPYLIAFGCGQLMFKGFENTINGHWTGAIGGSILILLSICGITLMVPLKALIDSMTIRYLPWTPVDPEEWKDVPQLTMEEMMELKSKLPWYLTEPTVEEVPIIDQLLSRMWPKINSFIQTTLDDKLINNSELMGKVFDATKGYLNLKIKSASIGTKVPKVTGIRVLKQGLPRDIVVVDFEFTFNSDVDFQIEAILDLGHINLGQYFEEHVSEGRDVQFALNAGLKSIDLRIRSRVILSPIFPSPPIVGTVNISLLEPPIIDWTFTGLLRPFNVTILKSLLIKLISSLIADPHSITINLAEFIPSQEMILGVPTELIVVEVINCSNLPTNQDKHSVMNLTFFKPDSFVVVEVDGEKRWTHIVSNNCDPKFNRKFSFMSSNPDQGYIKFMVYDDDMDQDFLIGQVSIPIKFWTNNGVINGGSINNGTGFISNLFHPIGLKQLTNEKREESTITYRVSTFKLSKDKSLISKTISSEERISAIISVFIDSATNLNQVPLASIRSPELRSLVRVEVGNNVEVTSIKDRTGNPMFKELLHVPAIDPRLENIKVSIVDMYWVMERRSYQIVGSKRKSQFTDWARASKEGNVIGSIEINTMDILNSPGMRMDGNYELTGFIEDGNIKMSVEIHLATSAEHVILNRALDPVQFPKQDIYLEKSVKSIPRDDGATIDTRKTINSSATSESGKKKSLINISNLDTKINVPISKK